MGTRGVSPEWAAPGILHAVSAIALSVWIINLGYGFSGSGSPLGRLEFVSRALAGDRGPRGEGAAAAPAANRFRGTWLGRIGVPVPDDYVEGIDRRWHEWETAPPPGDEQGWPVQVGGRAGRRSSASCRRGSG